jgi:hypothetical protein
MFRERWTALGPLLLETGFLITDRQIGRVKSAYKWLYYLTVAEMRN